MFNPLEVGEEHVPAGGHGPNGAHFSHSDGSHYDIQHIQMGWSITDTYHAGEAHAAHAAWLIFVAGMQNKDHFTPENISTNHFGLQLGINAAKDFDDFQEFIKSECNDKCN